ncbi:MAG: hypothetical protein NPMRTH1_1390013 [Nitrosopumilales archaeon]|nr:MAG: hypothetical protein NPMRTH1_1390013 [Nitrosopumilales archaeon]
MVIKENTLNRAMDNVENSLETFVLEQKSKCKNWVGMESLLVTQYTTRLDTVLQSKAYTALNQLETKHRFIVSNRLKDFLALAKDEYDKN